MGTNIIYPPNSTTLNDFRRTEPILSIKNLKDRYLFAVDLRDNQGNVLPDEVLAFSIDAAITAFEQECNLLINPVKIEEDRDYVITDYMSWSFIDLEQTPVISLDSMQIRFRKNSSFVTFPDNWLRLDNHTGVVRIAAVEGEIQNWIFTQFSYLPKLITRVRDFPHFFHIEYTAGFEQDSIPRNINHLIGMLAAIYVLNIAGDIVLGAGIAAQSLSIDGLSQSIQTTSSAENSAYSARIIQYAKLIKEMKAQILKYWGKDITMVVV